MPTIVFDLWTRKCWLLFSHHCFPAQLVLSSVIEGFTLGGLLNKKSVVTGLVPSPPYILASLFMAQRVALVQFSMPTARRFASIF